MTKRQAHCLCFILLIGFNSILGPIFVNNGDTLNKSFAIQAQISDIQLDSMQSSTNDTIQWMQTYSTNFEDSVWSVIQTSDAGFVLCGSSGAHGNYSAWLIKTDSFGNVQWTQTYNFSFARAVISTTDGGYALAGTWKDVIRDDSDAWLVKTNDQGAIQWIRVFDDAIQDGNQPYIIITNAASSTDLSYNGLDPDNVFLINIDNDSAGITVTPDAGIITTEEGAEASFTVVLNSVPSDDVTITLNSNDTSEGTISPSSITFTPINWSAQQTITITGIDDALQDGNQLYSIALDPAASTDPDYNGLDPIDVTATNNDNETPGFTIAPSTSRLNRLITSEGGMEAAFTIVLNSTPTADVTLPLSVSDISEASINKTSLTFTIYNWNAPQTVVVSGLDDDIPDGNTDYTVITGAASSIDTNYNAITPGDIFLKNTDNEQAGVTFDPIGLSKSPLITTESGGEITYTMTLNAPPTDDVVIDLTSNDTLEGTVSPFSLTFTAANWNIAQTVTVTGVDDVIADGHQGYMITAVSSSTDPDYDNLTIADVYMQNNDNETAGYIIHPDTFNNTINTLSTDESSGQDTFTIVLTKSPAADVTLTLSSNKTAEGSPSPATLVFTPSNWDAPQTVTVTGVDDGIADGNQPYQIRFDTAVSLDPDYDGLKPDRVYCINADND